MDGGGLRTTSSVTGLVFVPRAPAAVAVTLTGDIAAKPKRMKVQTLRAI